LAACRCPTCLRSGLPPAGDGLGARRTHPPARALDAPLRVAARRARPGARKLFSGVVPEVCWCCAIGLQAVGGGVVLVGTVLWVQRELGVLGQIACLFKPALCSPLSSDDVRAMCKWPFVFKLVQKADDDPVPDMGAQPLSEDEDDDDENATKCEVCGAINACAFPQGYELVKVSDCKEVPAPVSDKLKRIIEGCPLSGEDLAALYSLVRSGTRSGGGNGCMRPLGLRSIGCARFLVRWRLQRWPTGCGRRGTRRRHTPRFDTIPRFRVFFEDLWAGPTGTHYPLRSRISNSPPVKRKPVVDAMPCCPGVFCVDENACPIPCLGVRSSGSTL